MLKKVGEGSRSEFIEQIIRPVLEKYDPGPPCEFLEKIYNEAEKLASDALYRGDYAESIAYTHIMYRLQGFKALCSIEPYDRKTCEKMGGKWEENGCILPKPKKYEAPLV